MDKEKLKYINYLYESIIDSSNRYVTVLSDAVMDYFKDIPYVKDKYLITKSKLYDYNGKLFFKLHMYMNDYKDLISGNSVECDGGENVEFPDVIFILTITNDFNDCLEDTTLYKVCVDKNVEEWDKFKDYIINCALKKIYELYKKDFEIYLLPNIE